MIKRIIFLILIFSGMSVSLLAQEDDFNSVRIGLKIGSPIIVGLGGEYVLPLNTISLGINVEGSYFPLNRDYFPFIHERFEDTELNLIYGAGGLRMYFNKYGEGFNIGVYAGRYHLKVVQDYSYMGQTASGAVGIGVTVVMAKVGYRWMMGSFFIDIDAGYGLGRFDDTLEVTVNYPTTGKRTEYVNIEDVLPIAHGIVGSFEAGIAF